MRLVSFEFEPHVNSLDDEHTALELDFPQRLGDQPLVRRIDLTRFQRASKCSSESTRCRCDNVVQSRGMGLENVRRDLVMLSHSAVNAKNDWFRFGRQVRSADGTLHTFDANIGTVDNFGHPTSANCLIV